MKIELRTRLNKLLPIIKKPTTWAILIAVPMSIIGADETLTNNVSNLLSMISQIIMAVI